MRALMAIGLAIFALAAFTMVSTPDSMASGKQMAFEKLDYGQGLYGLPHVSDVRMNKIEKFDKIDFGQDLYGLPHVTGGHVMTWDKIDYGDGLYGLPHVSRVHQGS